MTEGLTLGIGRSSKIYHLQNQIPHEQLTFEKRQVTGDLSRLISQPEWTEESQVLNMNESNLEFKTDGHIAGDLTISSPMALLPRRRLPDLPSALFLCDSFTGSYLYKYLAPSFHRALFIHHQSMGIDHQKLVDELPTKLCRLYHSRATYSLSPVLENY